MGFLPSLIISIQGGLFGVTVTTATAASIATSLVLSAVSFGVNLVFRLIQGPTAEVRWRPWTAPSTPSEARWLTLAGCWVGRECRGCCATSDLLIALPRWGSSCRRALARRSTIICGSTATPLQAGTHRRYRRRPAQAGSIEQIQRQDRDPGVLQSRWDNRGHTCEGRPLQFLTNGQLVEKIEWSVGQAVSRILTDSMRYLSGRPRHRLFWEAGDAACGEIHVDLATGNY